MSRTDAIADVSVNHVFGREVTIPDLNQPLFVAASKAEETLSGIVEKEWAVQ
jgi:hypothetical protein